MMDIPPFFPSDVQKSIQMIADMPTGCAPREQLQHFGGSDAPGDQFYTEVPRVREKHDEDYIAARSY
jgi:hypothetical protein